MPKDAIFPKGLVIKNPHEKAPDFVRAKLHIIKDELIPWLNEQEDDWINCDVKLSQNGRLYIQVDTWRPTPSGNTSSDSGEKGADGLPF
jgi:hypothetical protein